MVSKKIWLSREVMRLKDAAAMTNSADSGQIADLGLHCSNIKTFNCS